LSLELAGIIVKFKLEDPAFVDKEFYKRQLNHLFKHNYEIKEIEDCLELLLGLQQDEVMVYPDDHIQGI